MRARSTGDSPGHHPADKFPAVVAVFYSAQAVLGRQHFLLVARPNGEWAFAKLPP
jgi:hypothetical protein